MSALSRRSFLQSTAVVAGAAAVVGPAARAVATGSSASSASSKTTVAAAAAATAAPAGPIIAYVDGSTVTVLSGDREVTRTDAELARRIARAAKNDS